MFGRFLGIERRSGDASLIDLGEIHKASATELLFSVRPVIRRRFARQKPLTYIPILESTWTTES